MYIGEIGWNAFINSHLLAVGFMSTIVYNYLNGVSYVCNKMQIRKTEIMVVGFVGEWKMEWGN